MAKYRFTGESPVSVPDLKRYGDFPVMPGEVIETDVEIHNAYFDLIEDETAPEPPAEPAPEATPEPEN